MKSGIRDPESSMRNQGRAGFPYSASRVPHTASRVRIPSSIAIDILDEAHSLGLAMARLARNAELRGRLGRAAQSWWQRRHSVEVMVEDYVHLLDEAAALPPPAVELPAHLRADGTRTLRSLAAPLGLIDALSQDGFLE